VNGQESAPRFGVANSNFPDDENELKMTPAANLHISFAVCPVFAMTVARARNPATQPNVLSG
jgi:hypothetical protein